MSTILTIIVAVILLVLLFKFLKILARLVFFAVLLVIAYFTNPRLDEHREAVRKEAAEEGVSLSGKEVTIQNVFAFSITQIQEGEKKRAVGVGAFAKVFIFGSL